MQNQFILWHSILDIEIFYSIVNSKGQKHSIGAEQNGAHSSWCSTYPIKADLGICVAGCKVFFRCWGGALGNVPIAYALKSTLRLVPAFHIADFKGALWCAAWTLTGTAREKYKKKINALLHLMI